MGVESHVRISLRDYQEDALQKVALAEASGCRRQLIVAATGLGKTVMFATLAERRRSRALVLAHRDELVTQAAAKILEVWPDLGATHATLEAIREHETYRHLAPHVRYDPEGVGIVKGKANDVHAHVIVGSVQTLGRSARIAKLTAPFTPGVSMFGQADPFGLVVIDEAHHARADTYTRIVDALGAGTDDGPLLVGVTATPKRGDGKGLDKMFDQVVAHYDILWGIGEGYLSDLRGVSVTLEQFNLKDVKISRGDYSAGEAGSLMMKAGAPVLLARAVREHAPDRKALVFCPTVAMTEAVAAEFVADGVRASWVSGETPADERRERLAAFSRGDLQVMVNCAVLTEGYDEPTVDCIVIARPTKSQALYVQMVGRGTRRHPDKADCLVLDVVGATDDHSLVTLPSLFGVEKRKGKLQDGTGLVSGLMREQHEEEVEQGRLRAQEVELFTRVRSGGIAWVALHRDGEPLRRYMRSVGRDRDGKLQPDVVLYQRIEGQDSWGAGLRYHDGQRRVLIADVSLEYAQGVGEEWVRAHTSSPLADVDAEWRKKSPTVKQRALADKWHFKIDPAWNAGEVSDALDAHIARITHKRKAPTHG